MIYHLADPESPKEIIYLTNPGYRSPEQLEEEKKSPFYIPDEDLQKLYCFDIQAPTIPSEMSSLAYCGERLIRKAKPHPELLWDSLNYTLACCLLDYEEHEICWTCVKLLDQIRYQQGYRPVIEYLKNPEDCGCANWVLMRNGCQCKNKRCS